MIKSDQPLISSKGQWRTVAELSLRGELGCEYEAAEKLAEILVSGRVPDQVLIEVKQAINRAMEKKLSHVLPDQTQRTLTLLVRTQLAQSLETPANEVGCRELHSRPRGWGFFLTEKRISETELGYPMDHVVISIHLYHEGNPA